LITVAGNVMKKQQAELRVVVKAGDVYAAAFFVSLRGYDLYYGPRLNFGQQLFRSSYHESGKSHIRLPTPTGRLIREPDVPLAKFKGKKKFGANSSTLQSLVWDYKPDADSTTRRTLILDLKSLQNVPSWTTELWVLESGRLELIEEAIKSYERGGFVIAHVHADWCNPTLLVVVWTLRPEAWASLEQAIENRG
jgi:hypothetical protein